jgi:hypothetical protein
METDEMETKEQYKNQWPKNWFFEENNKNIHLEKRQWIVCMYEKLIIKPI